MIKGIKVTVKSKGPGFSALLDKLARSHILIGIQGDIAKKKHGGPRKNQKTIGELAEIHELGRGQKKRSWLQAWFEENEKICRRDIAAAVRSALDGVSRKKALEKVGLKWAKSMRKRIISGGVRPGLAASTIRKKGGDTRPLYETGILAASITQSIYLEPRPRGATPLRVLAAGAAPAGVKQQGLAQPQAELKLTIQKGFLGKKFGPKLPPKMGPKQRFVKFGPKRPKPPKSKQLSLGLPSPFKLKVQNGPRPKKLGPKQRLVKFGPKLPPKMGPRRQAPRSGQLSFDMPKLPPKMGPRAPYIKYGPKLPPKMGPRLPPKMGPRLERFGPKMPPKMGPKQRFVKFGPRKPRNSPKRIQREKSGRISYGRRRTRSSSLFRRLRDYLLRKMGIYKILHPKLLLK